MFGFFKNFFLQNHSKLYRLFWEKSNFIATPEMTNPRIDATFLTQYMEQGYLKIYQTDLNRIRGLTHPADHFSMVFEFTNLPDILFLLCATSPPTVKELVIPLTENDYL